MSDEEQKEDPVDTEFGSMESNCQAITNEDDNSKIHSEKNSMTSETKETYEQTHPQTVEEIVGHILMQNQEFQKLLEKQRTNSILNVRQQQRFNKCVSLDSSDESDTENTKYNADSTNNRGTRLRSSYTRREQKFVRTNNAWNSISSTPQRDNQSSLRLRYDNLRQSEKLQDSQKKPNHILEKKAVFEAFKRQSIVTESKIIKTALRIRENSTSSNEEVPVESPSEVNKTEPSNNYGRIDESEKSTGFGNYDNLQYVWESLNDVKNQEGNDSPTRPAVWLTKLCEGLPISPQKSGSLPRSFQISPTSCLHPTKPRFLQRDGKPMSERPFTIASDKPAEINLEDMERYASSCQTGGRIAKFPTSASTSSSNFFCSFHDSMTDAYSDLHIAPTITNVHPDHKIYR